MQNQPQQQLNLLGTVRIKDGRQTIDQFRSHRAVALLIYLVSQAHPVPRSELIELIWPDKSKERGQANLRWALSYWNKLLPDCWDVTRQTAQFRPPAGCEVDVLALQAALAGDDVARLETAVSDVQDEFCRGFYVDESPEFETWLLTRREHWRQLLRTAWQRLIDHYSSERLYDRALVYARRALALDTWQESEQRQVMLLLARTGDFDAAWAQFESCRRILADELHIEPTRATRKLADRIRVLRERPRHNLPPQPTRFVGREAGLAALAKLLAAPDNRLVTIVAPGGMGKTRLAQAAAAAQTGAFLEGVAFVPLAPVESPALLATTIVEALSSSGFIEPHQGHRSAVDYLLDAVAEMELLLLLDNYEQLLPDISLILAILARAPQVKLLVTSRERLHTRWERPFPVSGLPYPEQADVPDWQQYGAPRLFLQSVQQIKPGFQPTPTDRAAITQICRLVEGMPLALELAAAWVRVQTPAAIAAEIADNLAVLQTRQRDLPARQRSMHAVFDQTWARLSAAERETLAQLSVFRGPFTVAAAENVTGADWHLLAALVDKSLLRHHRFGAELGAGDGDVVEMPALNTAEVAVYYEMHELLRQYGMERLAAQSAAAETRQRHGRYYAAQLADYEPQLRSGSSVTATLKRIRREIDNIRAAWEWALSAQQGESLNLMLESIYQFYRLPALVRDGQAVMAAASAQLAAVQNGDAALRLAYGRILVRQGGFAWMLHEDYAAAERLLRQGMAILAERPSGAELALAMMTLANLIYTWDLPAAQDYWQRSLDIYEQAGDLERQATILRNLCVTAATYAEMVAYWERALAAAQSGGDRRNEGHLYFIRGDREFQAGHLETAVTLTQKSVAIIRSFDDPPHLILALSVLADLLTAQQQLDQARAVVAEVQQLAGRISIKWHSLLVAVASARFFIVEQRFDEAEAALADVLASAPEEGSYQSLRQMAFYHRGRLHFLQGAYAAAGAAWQRCVAVADSTDFLVNSRRWRGLVGLGEVALCAGDVETAVSHFTAAHDLAHRIGADAAWEKEVGRLTAVYPTHQVVPGRGQKDRH